MRRLCGPYATWSRRVLSARLPCDAILGCGRFPGCRIIRTSWMRSSRARRTPERPSRRQAEIAFWRDRCRGGAGQYDGDEGEVLSKLARSTSYSVRPISSDVLEIAPTVDRSTVSIRARAAGTGGCYNVA